MVDFQPKFYWLKFHVSREQGKIYQVRFLNSEPSYNLTYDDVFMVPNKSEVLSRNDVDLTSTDGLGTPLPIAVANMTAISGRRMAETVARRGGIAIIPQDLPTDIVIQNIDKVKASHPVFDTPITVTPDTTVNTILNLLPRRAHGTVVVMAGKTPIGLVSASEAAGADRFAQAQDVMTTEITTVSPQDSAREIFELLATKRHKIALACENDQLIGVTTAKGTVRSTLYPPALDANGKLKIGVAIGISGDVAGRTEELLRAGADVLVLDTAHGHQLRMIEAVKIAKEIRDDLRPEIKIVAGNIVTAKGVAELLEAGADVIKVGVGPGAMCTTRMQTGVGRPQFSAVLECADEARRAGKAIWADGGVRHPRDVALALAAGAGSVMIGSWFAGTHESTGDLLYDPQGRAYKESFGMASARAVRARTRLQSGFDRARAALFEEGISTSRMYLDPERPGVEDLIDFIVGGVKSSCTYAGARNLREFHNMCVIGVQSRSGFEEGRPLYASWQS